MFGVAIASLSLAVPVAVADKSLAPQWNLPEAREIAFGRKLCEAYD